jgi:CubicO group peptidase (beta-lactamase class C family)
MISLFVIAGLLMTGRGNGTADNPAPALVGLWGCERTFGPEVVHGRLTLVQQGAQWRAEIAGHEVPVEFADGNLKLVLPGGRGQFRGRMVGGAIQGHWIQPLTVANGTAYATPVELKPVHSHLWQGQVEPMEDRRSFYLVIRREKDGSLGAFLRNPEANSGRFMPIGAVIADGDRVHFTDRERREDLLVGRWNTERTTFSLYFPNYGQTLDFTRRSRDEATGFYPRSLAEAAYVYRPPLAAGDGWPTAALTDVGLDPVPLRRLVEQILATETTGVESPYIQSVLIARHGKLVMEEYFYGFDRDRPHDWRSAGKTLASTLVGIAIDHGAPFDVTTPIYTLFPQYKAFAHPDPRKSRITVEHLLTMSSGLDGDDSNDDSPGNEDRMQSQTDQPDWYKYALDLAVTREPGERGVYFTGGINLLGGIVENTTRIWLPDFLYERFAQPLGIRRYHLNLTPLGNAYMGGGIQMRPRDFLKFGQLFLDHGRWKGQQVVSERWVERATRPHSGINTAGDYGYAWWIRDYQVGGKAYHAFSAQGNGGQGLFVFPDLDLVVLSTGGNYSSETGTLFRDRLIPEFILPALAGTDRAAAH